MKWYAIRRTATHDFYVGAGLAIEFTPELSEAKLYSDLEMENTCLFKGEEWFEMPEQGDA